ncbi:MAG TPA: type II toxin-antitoxin system VapC family toxin [Xanthobacteraceae bacterium]|nr:type II toxin-antitoxin system VapC family toxin [Xanthobacteraceae bacterium]
MAGILLDTHAALWLMSGEELSPDVVKKIQAASGEETLFVSPITAWEIATLVRKGRIALTMPADSWFSAMLGKGIELAEMSPDTLIASVFLPGEPPNDPADRIIIATARSENLILVTRDDKILQYAEHGHTRVLSC